jgi:hypothetical protein
VFVGGQLNTSPGFLVFESQNPSRKVGVFGFIVFLHCETENNVTAKQECQIAKKKLNNYEKFD